MPERSRCRSACGEAGLPKNVASPSMRARRMPSQSSSASATRTCASVSARPTARATASEPKISTPRGSGSATFSHSASGRAVALCSTTVPMIRMNTSGTSTSAPATPSACRRSANSAETEAATMPRGATQAISARSRQPSALPRLATSTVSGRTTNCANRKIAKPAHSRCPGSGQGSRAASRMNSSDTSSVVRCSLKSRMSSTCTPRMLPSAMPMIVTVSRPDSCAIALEPAKASSTAASVP